MRIAHLSDLHLCSKFKSENLLKLEKLIIEAIEKGAQHFVFTGDITDNANKEELINFKDVLIKFGIHNSKSSTVIIGNHDIFGGPQIASDVPKFPSQCLKVNYKEKVKNFVAILNSLFEDCIWINKDSLFPFAKVINDVALIGINTIDEYSLFKNPFASNGRIKKEQRKDLLKLLSLPQLKNKLKIILSHHHFYQNKEKSSSSEKSFWDQIENYTMKLKGKKKLLKLFSENDIKIVLHGHSHEVKQYKRKEMYFFNTGGGFEGDLSQMYIVNAFPFDISGELCQIDSNDVLIEKNIEVIAV